MEVWLIIIVMAAMRAVYSAAVEAFVTWGLFNFILPDVYYVPYWFCYIIWFIIGFVVACRQIKRFM